MSLSDNDPTTFPRMSGTTVCGWVLAIGVWLVLIWWAWHDSASIEFWLLLIGLGGGLLGLLGLDRLGLADRRRVIALRQLANEHGWLLLPDGHADVLAGFQRFELGNRCGRVHDHSHPVSNLLTGTINTVRFYVFDFAFWEGSTRHGGFSRQSVVWLQMDAARLPSLTVFPAKFWWTRVRESEIGRQNLDLSEPGWFTKQYDVRSEFPQEFLRLLTPEVLSCFRSPETLAVECSGRNLIVCEKSARLLKPEELIPLLNWSDELMQKLCETTSSGRLTPDDKGSL